MVDAYFLDGCAVLWAVERPSKGRPTVQDYIDAFPNSPSRSRTANDINASVSVNFSIIPGLLAAHALTGCDTVASYYGISKGRH